MTTKQYNTFAREFGHVLGLSHVENPNNFMAHGAIRDFIDHLTFVMRLSFRFSPLIIAAVSLFVAGCTKEESGKSTAATSQTNQGRQLGELESVVPQKEVLETNELRAIDSKMNFDQEMIQVVRNWYAAKNLKVPENIVVHDWNTNLWRIIADSNFPDEMWFEVDPSAKRVIRAIGD